LPQAQQSVSDSPAKFSIRKGPANVSIGWSPFMRHFVLAYIRARPMPNDVLPRMYELAEIERKRCEKTLLGRVRKTQSVIKQSHLQAGCWYSEHPQAKVAEQVKVCGILSLVVGHNGVAN
jgi:hypothetical protein